MSAPIPFRHRPLAVLRDLSPGLALCASVGAAAVAVETGERFLLGRSWIEALVLAILCGAAVRTAWTPGPRWHAGVGFARRGLLEVAVVLLGAAVSPAALAAAGPALVAGVAALVVAAIAAGFAIGRLLRLPARMALLVACGNAICGNSAIATVAPVIEADADDVAVSIAFTAALGIAVMVLLPLAGLAVGLDRVGFGVLAGLTVYAVPQVAAAAAPFGATAVQIGMVVKLVRVAMLGPVCLALSLVRPGRAPSAGGASRPPLVPWFVLGFAATAACRAAGLVPEAAIAPIDVVAHGATVLAMAALGLGVDVRMLARAGARVVAAVTLSLALLALAAYALVAGFGL